MSASIYNFCFEYQTGEETSEQVTGMVAANTYQEAINNLVTSLNLNEDLMSNLMVQDSKHSAVIFRSNTPTEEFEESKDPVENID